MYDVDMFTHFLQKAGTGMSLNLLTHHIPSVVAISDLCPFGMGGFLWTGHAWHLKIPADSIIYEVNAVNSVLEFLVMVITIWLSVHNMNSHSECIIGLGDNTSALWWLYHYSKLKVSSKYYDAVELIARKLALVITKLDHQLCSQHLPGNLNHMADYLSYHTQCSREFIKTCQAKLMEAPSTRWRAITLLTLN